jgi:hypothetical protein
MLGQLLEMMKKAVKGAYAAKLQQHTVVSGIIEAPAPVVQGEGERMVQGNGGDMSAVTSSSSFPSTSHEVDNGFLPIPIPVPVLAPVPTIPSSTGEEDGASASLSLILTIPPSTAPTPLLPSSSSSSSASAPSLVSPLGECPPLSNDVDQALSSFTTSGTYVCEYVRSPVYSHRQYSHTL